MKNEEQAILEMLTEYIGTFVVSETKTWDPEIIKPYYTEPATLINPERVVPIPTYAQLTAIFGGGINALIEAKDYNRTVAERMSVKQTSETSGIAHSFNIRYRIDGTEIEKFGTTFVVLKQENQWKIAALIDHDADAELANVYETKMKKNGRP